ncbi:hypothetical protein HII17_14825 [Thalassotalea sp. M1531]|uniref:Alpha/beta hydrolase n=1 Tax=Thalassotalea algicola TaxID=2716224 RepID=A0A7Y0LEL2_9GAMM|nr:hypothetical protein [Thalassotalea algicola]NMP32828.1 hypothetical protein [Thalassotalea algicola]
MNTIRRIVALAAVCSALISTSVFAKEYKIILIHGFQPQQLISDGDVTQSGQAYWQGYWNALSDERIDWPSYERIEGKIATDYVWPKLKSFSQSNLCEPGCIFVTHSTGDLVARYIIENQATWLENAGLSPLNIVATFDIAGAGGGSELADLAVSVAQNTEAWTFAIEAALEAWLGGDLTDEMGVLHDLKVNNARQLAALPDARIPRLRFVGDASDYLGVTSPFIQGNDDGVVGSHSACGGNRQGRYGSCSDRIDFNGKSTSQSDAVSGFMPYHYPMLMSDKYSHGSLLEPINKGKVTAASSSEQLMFGENISFNTYTTTSGWWLWKSNYVYVSGSNNDSMSELIYAAMPN